MKIVLVTDLVNYSILYNYVYMNNLDVPPVNRYSGKTFIEEK